MWNSMKVLLLLTVLLLSGMTSHASEKPARIITSMDWSPNGDVIAVGYGTNAVNADPCGSFVSGGDSIELISPVNKSLVNGFPRQTCNVNSVDFNQTGTQLIASYHSGLFILWDVATGATIGPPSMIFSTRTQATWSPNNTLIGIIEGGQGVIAYDSTTREAIRGYGSVIYPNAATDFAWQADQQAIAVSSDSGTIEIVSTSDHTRQQLYSSHESAVTELDWNHSHGLVASGDQSGAVHIWNPDTGETLHILSESASPITDVAWNNDGTLLAFADESGAVLVWSMTEEAAVQRIAHPGPVYALAWSPDGDQLAYGGARTDGLPAQVEIIELRGNNRSDHQLHVVFQSTPEDPFEPSQIHYVSLDGTEITPLQYDDHNGSGIDLGCSPSGRYISFLTGDLTLLGSSLENVVRLLSSRDIGTYTGTSVSADGTLVAFVDRRDAQVMTINVPTGAVTRLTNYHQAVRTPQISPDGTTVLFVGSGDAYYHIYSVTIDGQGLQQLTDTSGFDFDPSWSPDGSRIAFASIRDHRSDANLYMMNADGTEVGQITDFTGALVEHPIWSPDGRFLAFASDHQGNMDIYVMNTDGNSQVSQLTDLPSYDSRPCWLYTSDAE
jgi:Tol biopolymer transport system component